MRPAEYDHYGFIEFEGEKLFLAGNVLVQFPKKYHEKLQLIAFQEGAFPIGDNKFIKTPEDTIHLLHLVIIGVADQSGMYKRAMRLLLDDQSFTQRLKVEHHFCKMVGGNTEDDQWGKIILAFIFSFNFLDEIYDHFKHLIFLYLYGEGNVGKGEVAKRFLDFYGVAPTHEMPVACVDVNGNEPCKRCTRGLWVGNQS